MSLSYYDPKLKITMLPPGGDTEVDVYERPSMMRLENKNKLVLLPYKHVPGIDTSLRYLRAIRDSHFEVSYHIPSKSFFFYSWNIPLHVTFRQDPYFSILDFDNTAVVIELKAPEIRNSNCFFNLDSSYINFEINFSNKLNTNYYYSVKPAKSNSFRFWPEFRIPLVTFSGKSN